VVRMTIRRPVVAAPAVGFESGVAQPARSDAVRGMSKKRDMWKRPFKTKLPQMASGSTRLALW
jgi:hypothetical protein